MELRQYWQIVWKRIWIPLLLIGVVLAVSVGLRRPPPRNITVGAGAGGHAAAGDGAGDEF